MQAHRCFTAEHHYISPIQNGIGNVDDLGAGRRRVFDHAVHHLGSYNDGFCFFNALVYDHFLQHRQALHGYLYPQISPCHHYPIRRFDDAVDVVNRFWFFYFGNNFSACAFGFYFLTQFVNVFCRTHKRQGNPIEFVLQNKLQIL